MFPSWVRANSSPALIIGTAVREEESSHEISTLPPAERIHLRVIGRAFGAAIPRVGIIIAVPIFFSVRLVVFIIVGNDVVQSKSIERCNKVDASVRPLALVLVALVYDLTANDSFHPAVYARRYTRPDGLGS